MTDPLSESRTLRLILAYLEGGDDVGCIDATARILMESDCDCGVEIILALLGLLSNEIDHGGHRDALIWFIESRLLVLLDELGIDR